MKNLRTIDKFIYGLGNISNGVVLQALSTYLVFFGTSVLGVSGSLVGTMVAVSVAWDAVSDPLIGHMSDFTNSRRFGRRHLYMFIGTIGLAIFNALLWFIKPEWSGMTKSVLLFTDVILIKSFITVVITPYNALGAELSTDYHERTSIQAYRTVFFILGLGFSLVAGMFFYFNPTEEYPVGQLNPEAYISLGLTISFIVLICSTAAAIGTWKYIPYLPQPPVVSDKMHMGALIKEFKGIFENRNYLTVAGAYLSANIATALLGAIGLHVFTYTFEIDNIGIGVIFGTLFGLSMLTQPFWLDITKRYDKRNGALLATVISLIGAVVFLVMVFIREIVIEQYLLLLVYAVPSGIGMGGLVTLPFSMIADTVDEEELATGIRSEGLYYGGLTFSYKISQSAAIFIVGVILDLAGFNASLSHQSDVTVLVLGLVIALGSIIALTATVMFYRRYRLTKEKVDAIKIAIMAKEVAKTENAI